jgi:hypothetical protein
VTNHRQQIIAHDRIFAFEQKMMRFRLRTLMIVLALLAGLFARIGYLKSRAAFHRRQVSSTISRLVTRPLEMQSGITQAVMNRAIGDATLDNASVWKQIRVAQAVGFKGKDEAKLFFHEIMADRYERAAYRPWRLVPEAEAE